MNVYPVDVDEAEHLTRVGAQVTREGVGYRVWAPGHARVGVFIQGAEAPRALELKPEPDGYFSGTDPRGKAGDLYYFDIAGQNRPDPASRYQPHGIEGPSQVVDPATYAWRRTSWVRPSMSDRIIYELHVGTFTPEGTFQSAITKLDALVELGVNTIELMPVADFAGDRNWGYDGVMLFAPARCYGSPDDLRALVDAAHERGLAVILDVVYNHLGAVGNVLPCFSSRYFHEDRESIWGKVLNFDQDAAPCRRFFIQNACHWLDEYRIDGLRLDAVHAIEDSSPTHIIAEIAAAGHRRGAFLIAEDERNEAKLITPVENGGWGLDAVWADDFHHTARVALTGQNEAHYASFKGTLDEWTRTLRQGWLYEGQHCPHIDKPRGTPGSHRPPFQFVHCISNHDQVGNRPLGDRLHDVVSPEAYRALSMLLCLTPYTPMIFMGQEWAAGTPFVFFTDLPGETGAGMAANRLKEFEHYGANYGEDVLSRMPDPQSADAFYRSKLNWAERSQAPHQGVLNLYRTCLSVRSQVAAFRNPDRGTWTVEKMGDSLLALRWTAEDGDWLLLIGVSNGEGIAETSPILGTKPGKQWVVKIASNDPLFGGNPSRAILKKELNRLVLTLPGAVLFKEV